MGLACGAWGSQWPNLCRKQQCPCPMIPAPSQCLLCIPSSHSTHWYSPLCPRLSLVWHSQARFKTVVERDLARSNASEYVRLLRHAREQLELAGQKRRKAAAAEVKARRVPVTLAQGTQTEEADPVTDSESGLPVAVTVAPPVGGNAAGPGVLGGLPALPPVAASATTPLASLRPGALVLAPLPQAVAPFTGKSPHATPGVPTPRQPERSALGPSASAAQHGEAPADRDKLRHELVSSAEALWKARRHNAKLKAKVEMYRQRLAAIEKRLAKGDTAGASVISQQLQAEDTEEVV